MNIRDEITAIKDEIAGYRRAMHENPQTAYEETFASDLVAEKLSAWGIVHERGIAVTGIVATIEGRSNKSGRSIGLRADMDALDIIEEDNKAWKSKNPGKMHACGHDGHTACLLGAAKYLSENNDFDGIVHLIFQPAEEGHRGAHKMIEEGLFERFPCDAVYGLHNWPYMPKGFIGMRAGPIMASADTFHIKVLGQGGHAAKPNVTIDPITIGSQIVSTLQTLVSRETSPIDPAVISVTYFNAGTGAHNIIPEEAKLTGTLRTYDREVRARLKARIGEVAKGVAQAMGGDIEYVFHDVLDPTVNDAAQAAFCAEVARGIVGAENVDDDVEPSMGGEDFGAMMENIPGCYIWMGQGEAEDGSNHNFGLHTPQYDFNDEMIPLAVEYWAQLVEKALPLS
jgi:amidohydrolase